MRINWKESENTFQKSNPNQRKIAGLISFVVSTLLFLVKWYAYRKTNSQAVLSDALESTVNIVASLVTLVVLFISIKPADKDHPYGHGKVEYFASSFEGGAITFAGLMVVFHSAQAFFLGHVPHQLELGMWMVLITALVNFVLGLYLKRVGERSHSLALVASGKHVLSDFWTSAAVVLGLVFVNLSGWNWLDSGIAMVLGAHLSWSGFGILLKSGAGLMDAEDLTVIRKLGEQFEKHIFPGMIRIHYVRVIRSGSYHHIDLHLVVPEFWPIKKAHDESNEFERKVMTSYIYEGEMHFHLDPCRQFYCKACDLKDCPIRKAPFESRIPFTLEELTSPTEPAAL